MLDSLTSVKQDKILLIGDFNFPNINWNNYSVGNNLSPNSSAYKFISCLRANFFTQYVQFPTRARGSQTPHTLDLIITNEDFVADILNLVPLGKSDHSVLHCVCNLNLCAAVNISKLNYSKGDYTSYYNYVRSNLVDNFDNDRISISDSWKCLKSLLLSGQDLFIPHVANNKWKKKAWHLPIKEATRNLIRQKHRCWTRFQRNHDKKYLIECKRIGNLVRKETRLIKQTNQREIAQACKTNPKKFWQYVRSKTGSASGIGDLKVVDGATTKTISSDFDKAETFSDYFEKISLSNQTQISRSYPRFHLQVYP
jgi:hypothetical protein